MHRTVLLALLACALIVFCAAMPDPPARSWADWRQADREELKRCFDQVARNQGAVENAYYSFTLEFRRVPHSIREMQDTGHLTVPMVSPYTGQAPHYHDAESINGLIHDGSAMPGDLWFRPDVAGGEVGIAGLYMDPNNPVMTKWMRADIVQYINEADRLVMFPPVADPRDRVMRINMEHLVEAIDAYVIRFGQVPPSWADLAAGDTRVDAANPYAPGESISEWTNPLDAVAPGQFIYSALDEKTYAVTGFGVDGPVYYFANDNSRWAVRLDPATHKLEYENVAPGHLQEMVENPDDSMDYEPNKVINKYIYMDWLDHMVDLGAARQWPELYPDCPECGSTEAMWTEPAADGTKSCYDTITGNPLPDCCCEAMDQMAITGGPAPDEVETSDVPVDAAQAYAIDVARGFEGVGNEIHQVITDQRLLKIVIPEGIDPDLRAQFTQAVGMAWFNAYPPGMKPSEAIKIELQVWEIWQEASPLATIQLWEDASGKMMLNFKMAHD